MPPVTPPPSFALSAFEEIGAGSEANFLPATKAQIRTAFFRFPVESAGCTPASIEIETTDIPRFSLFDFPQVSLSGFRLYSVDGRFFNELSLVDKAPANDQFSALMSIGYNEALTFDRETGVPVVPSVVTLDCSDCAVLVTDQPANFGHVMMYTLPKLVLTQLFRPVTRIMVSTHFDWMRRLMLDFAPNIEIVSHKPRVHYRLLNPVIPSLAVPRFYYRPEVRHAFDPFIEKAVRAHPQLRERIYISRRKQAIVQRQHRVMENETELVERLSLIGFEEIIPEDMPFTAQMAAISQAKVIVTAGGSNMFGCYHARKAELILDIEASPYFQQTHANVLASCGLPYSMISGKLTGRGRRPVEHPNWSIDVDAVLTGLHELGCA